MIFIRSVYIHCFSFAGWESCWSDMKMIWYLISILSGPMRLQVFLFLTSFLVLVWGGWGNDIHIYLYKSENMLQSLVRLDPLEVCLLEALVLFNILTFAVFGVYSSVQALTGQWLSDVPIWHIINVFCFLMNVSNEVNFNLKNFSSHFRSFRWQWAEFWRLEGLWFAGG